MNDSYYYGTNGDRVCDNFGNSFYVSDGNNTYDLEGNIVNFDDKKIFNNQNDKHFCFRRIEYYLNNPTQICKDIYDSIVNFSNRFQFQ